MKYLKLFESSRGQEIKDFCSNSLSYLIDYGYTVSVVEIKDDYHISIKYEYGFKKSGKEIRWKEIKDMFVPFYKLLNKYYNIKYLKIFGRRFQYGEVLFDTIYNPKERKFSHHHMLGWPAPSKAAEFLTEPSLDDNKIVSIIQIIID